MSNPEIRNIQRIADIERRYQEVINSLLLDTMLGLTRRKISYTDSYLKKVLRPVLTC